MNIRRLLLIVSAVFGWLLIAQIPENGAVPIASNGPESARAEEAKVPAEGVVKLDPEAIQAALAAAEKRAAVEAQEAANPLRIPGDRSSDVLVPRGPNHTVHLIPAFITNELQEIEAYTKRIIQIETGLNRQDENLDWVPTSTALTLEGDAAVSRQTRHFLRIASQLNQPAAITVVGPGTPEVPGVPAQPGVKLSFTPIGLVYFDPVTSQSTVVAKLREKVPGFVANGDTVIFPNAFEDVDVTIRYRNGKSGLEQDILFPDSTEPGFSSELPNAARAKAGLPDPKLYGMNPDTVRLQIVTEFFDYTPPVKEVSIVGGLKDPEQRRQSVEPDLVDENLSFGDLRIRQGAIFSEGNPRPEGQLYSAKQFQKLDNGRTILFETVPYQRFKSLFNSPPTPGKPGPEGAAVPRHRLILPEVGAPTGRGEPMIARNDYRSSGVVFDFPILVMGNTTNSGLTLRGDSTYLITGIVAVDGPLIIEGGAVCKYVKFQPVPTDPVQVHIRAFGTVTCQTSPWRPAVFTAIDDNSVGEVISGIPGVTNTSTGVPNGIYGSHHVLVDPPPALWGTETLIQHCRFRYGYSGPMSFNQPQRVRHCQFIRMNIGAYYNNAESTIENCLFAYPPATNGWTGSPAAILEYVRKPHRFHQNTIHNLGFLLLNDPNTDPGITNTPIAAEWRNNLIIGVPSLINSSGSALHYTNSVGDFYSATDIPETFATHWQGAHYLPTNSLVHRNLAINGNISSNLLAEVQAYTTTGPQLLNGTAAPDTILGPRGLADTGALDRGYHYPISDYHANAFTVGDYQTLALTNGVVVLGVNPHAFNLNFHSRFISEGKPTAPNRILRHHLVQEGDFDNPTTNEIDTVIGHFSTTIFLNSIWFRYTDFPALSGPDRLRQIFKSPYNPSSLSVRDCTFGGSILNCQLQSATAQNTVIQNNLFDRGHLNMYWPNGSSLPSSDFTIRNNLFWRGGIRLQNTNNLGAIVGELRDNIFDNVAATNFILTPGPLALSHNAYVYASGAPNFGEAIKTNLTTLPYATGPLGRWYQDNSALTDLGQRNATVAGLYHQTTKTNQTKELGSQVDVGFHYVALNASGQPADSNGDGLPDHQAEPSQSTGLPLNVLWTLPTHNQVGIAPPNAQAVAFELTTASAGAIQRVEFYAGSTLIATRTSTPYTASWTPAAVPFPNVLSTWTRVVGTNNSIWDSFPRNLIIVAGTAPNTPPAISWQTPTSNQVFPTGPTNVYLSVTAADAGGSIASVQFFQGTNLLGATTVPVSGSIYAYTWTNLPSGSYTVIARATDNLGATKDATNSFTVNTPPVVSWQTPTNGTFFPFSPTNVYLSVNASDAGGSIANVQFFQGTNLLGTTTTPVSSNTYAFIWTNRPSGNYTVIARATDNLGATKEATNSFIINTPPTISWQTPTNNQVFPTGPTNIYLSVNATDSAGSITNVQFFQGTNLLGATTTPVSSNTYAFTWTNRPSGSYSVIARATDNLGATQDATNSFTVTGGTVLAWLTPTNGAVLPSNPQGVYLSVTATNSGGSIASVQFFVGASLLGSAALVSGSTYALTWPIQSPGSYTVTARATDNLGAIVNANTTFSLVAPPVIVWQTPTPGSTLPISPTNVFLSVTATNSGGSITNVEFFQGSTLIGSTTSPLTNSTYGISWVDRTNGTYTVKARAWGNNGGYAEATATFTLNGLPTIAWIVPTTVVTGLPNKTVDLKVLVTDADPSPKVEFLEFKGATSNLLATLTTANSGANQYLYQWNVTSSGQRSVYARATDNQGGVRLSEMRVIDLGPSPVVAIISPTNGTKLPAYSSPVIQAQASITNSQIAYVEFYAGTNFLGRDTTVSTNSAGLTNIFEQELSGLPPGTYELTARAVDTSSPARKRISPVVSFTVLPSLPGPLVGEWDATFGSRPFGNVSQTCAEIGLSLAITSDDVLYFGGVECNSSGSPHLTTRKNCIWQNANPLGSTAGGIIHSMLARGQNLYAFGHSGTVPYAMFELNGVTTNILGNSLIFPTAAICERTFDYVNDGIAVHALKSFGGDLYIGGSFIDADPIPGQTLAITNLHSIAKMSAGTTNWVGVCTNVLNDRVVDLVMFRGNLYAGGYFTAAGTNTSVRYLARLNNQQWEPVGLGVNGPVSALVEHNGRLFVGGEFTTAGGLTNANCLATWDGQRWGTIGSGVGGNPSTLGCDPTNVVLSIAAKGNDIFVTGVFQQAYNRDEAVNARLIAKATWHPIEQNWIWSPLGEGLTQNSPFASYYGRKLLVIDHKMDTGYDVIVAGRFSHAGGVIAQNIARWVYGTPDCQTPGPSVTITTPTNTAKLPGNSAIFGATATAPNGSSIEGVEYILNGLGGIPASLASGIWSSQVIPLTGGVNTIRAIVTSQNDADPDRKQTAASAPVTFVVPASTSPLVTNETFTILSSAYSTNLNVLANDGGAGPLRLVRAKTWAYAGAATSLGTATVTPQGDLLMFQPRQFAFGRCYVTYDVMDNLGTVSGMATVDLKSPPLVTITAPVDGFAVTTLASLNIQGQARDYDGAISNVTLYVNSAVSGSPSTATNFSISWMPPDYGHYQIAALGRDFENITNASAPITIAVRASDTTVTADITSLQVTNTQYSSLPFSEYPLIREGFLPLQGQAFATVAGSVTRATSTVSYRIQLQPTFEGIDNDGAQTYNVTPGVLNYQGFVAGGDNGGSLGTLDLTQVLNGVYDLVLTVRCRGVEASETNRVSILNESKIGNFTFSEQDLVIPVNGVPLTVVRKYDSLAGEGPDFGRAWTLSINDMEVQLDEDRTPTPVFAFNGTDPNDGGQPMFSLRTGGGRNVSLVMPDGRRGNFLFKPRISVNPQKPFAWAEWLSPPGVTARLVVAGSVPDDEDPKKTINFAANGSRNPVWSYGEARTPFEAYDIPGYDLVLKDGTKFELRRDPDFGTANNADWITYDSLGNGSLVPVSPYSAPPKLRTIVQPSGDKVEIKPDGINHSYNGNLTRKVAFTRDDRGRISAIADPAGTTDLPAVRYLYNDDKNVLVQVLRLDNRTTGQYLTNRYYYDLAKYPTYLTRIIDARGLTVARNEYDDSGRLTAIIDALGRTNRFIHDVVNRTEYVIDRLNATNTLVYDARGNITTNINALGEVRHLGYDPLNNKLAETNYLGTNVIVSRWQYDTNSLLTATFDPLGNSNVFVYDSLHRLYSTTDPRGNVTTVNSYDVSNLPTSTSDSLGSLGTSVIVNGLVQSSTDPLGTVTTFSYNANRNLTNTTVTSASGTVLSRSGTQYDANLNPQVQAVYQSKPDGSYFTNLTTYYYDAQNRVTQTVEPDGGASQVIYNEIGRQAATIDKLGRQTTYQYDVLGNLAKIIYPDVNVFETFEYDAQGRRTNHLDRLGRSSRMLLDPLGRATNSIQAFSTPEAATNQTVYDALGRVAYTVDARGNINAVGYDAAGRRTSTTNAYGTAVALVSRFVYDAAGSVTTNIDALNRETATVYDLRGRPTSTLAPPLVANGPRLVSGITYDALGRRVAEVNALGLTNTSTYDGVGRLLSTFNGMGTSSGLTAATNWAYFQYDTAGNLTNQIDALNRSNFFSYDALGRRVTTRMPNGQTTSYGYDLAGNQIAMTSADGVIVTNQFDMFNRLWRRGITGTNLETYAYSASGRLTSRLDASGTQTFSYDNRDRLTNNTTPVGTLRYTYDRNGNQLTLSSATANGVNLTYSYDALNRLTNVLDANLTTANKNTAYQFDPVGNLAGMNLLACNVTNQYVYDARNRLTSLAWKTGGGVDRATFTYTLNELGSRTLLADMVNDGVNNVSRTYSWTYDHLQRLQGETITGANGGNLGYGFDLVGNRTNQTGSLGSMVARTFTYDRNDWTDHNAITNDLNTWFDPKGNRLTGTNSGSYTYDWANRLTNFNGGLAMVYDADGKRVAKGGLRYLVATVNPTGYPQVVEEFADFPPVTLFKVYSYGLSRVHQRNVLAGATRYYGTDGQGTVRFLLNNAGAVSDTYVYDSYGNLNTAASSTPTDNSFRYAGEYWDAETGLYYLRARYYRPDEGRFWSRDTFEGNQSDPLSLHRYLYTQGNPINMVDPSGHESLVSISFTSAILGQVGAHYLYSSAKALGAAQRISGSTDFSDLIYGLEVASIVQDKVSLALGAAGLTYATAKVAKFLSTKGYKFFGTSSVRTLEEFRAAASKAASYYEYAELRAAINAAGLSGSGTGLEAHHLLHQVFAQRMGLDPNRIIAVPLTPANHRNVGRLSEIGAGENVFQRLKDKLTQQGATVQSATVEQIWRAHKNAYEEINHPEWAHAIYEAYFQSKGIAF